MRASARAFALAWTLFAGSPVSAADVDCTGSTGKGLDHPLACRVFDAEGKRMPRAALVRLMRSAPFVALGEVHDNPDIHRERARLIHEASAGKEKTPALVFEHIRDDQKSVLQAYAAERQAETSPPEAASRADALLAALDWSKSGWPDALMFKPLFVEAVAGRHRIYAGDAAKGEVRKIAMEGAKAIDEPERTWLKLDEALPQALEDALLGELEASHCGLMPRTAFGNMSLAQRYRDAHLAAAFAAAVTRDGAAVLLAGNEHVRRDRGVPFQLARMLQNSRLLVVEFLEVEDGKTEAAAYVPRAPDGTAAADLIVLMPRTERPDPCEEMRKRFNK